MSHDDAASARSIVAAAVAGFEAHLEAFGGLTRTARRKFAARDWEGIRRDTVRRLQLHNADVDAALAELRRTLGPRLSDPRPWARAKQRFALEILGRDDCELAQTFFNSLNRRALRRTGVDPALDFLASDAPLPHGGWEMAAARTYGVREVDHEVVRKVLGDLGLDAPFRDLGTDARRAAERIRAGLREHLGSERCDALDVLRPPFVRNKGAYVIGRARRGERVMPVVLALLHGEAGVAVDAVLTDESETSIVFSFARWYFLADVAAPREVIGFLRSILPRKRVSELYLSLGYHKHGKTEFYRDLMEQTRRSDERFVEAPGEEGLVMKVFTLPSFEFVFKVIKDRFPGSKQVTPRQVRENYRLVLRRDRVGRLVDFQEFTDLTFPRTRFSPGLLAELVEQAGRRVQVRGEEVIVRHVYVGRRVTPLDVFLERERDPGARRAAVLDWGACIKDLAAAGVFAGDMLLKNFGVTRHGRVVFYDYDELGPLTDCRFRRLPPARHDYQELADEPWFAVREGDVFPEQIRTFLQLTGELRDQFEEAHADLYSVELWRDLQRRVEAGEILDVFPYPEQRRLAAAPAARPAAEAAAR